MIDTLKQVREALNDERYVSKYSHIVDCIAKLDALIAEKAEPQSEFDVRGILASKLTCWHCLSGKEAQELVDLFEQRDRQPLTDGQILQAWENHTIPIFSESRRGINPIVFARAIEAAHGIGGKPAVNQQLTPEQWQAIQDISCTVMNAQQKHMIEKVIGGKL